MPVTFNLRHLEEKDLRLKGELPAVELDAEDFDDLIKLSKPLFYDLMVEKLPDSILVQGQLRLELNCECARCLSRFVQRIELDSWAVDVRLEGPDRVPVNNDTVDLTPLIREDSLLAFPQHPLCGRDRCGLPQASRQVRPGSVSPGVDPAADPWAELNKLKF